MYIINMKYQTEQEKKEAQKRNLRECYYRKMLKMGKIPKAIKERALKIEQEKDVQDLIADLQSDIMEQTAMVDKTLEIIMELQSEISELKAMVARISEEAPT